MADIEVTKKTYLQTVTKLEDVEGEFQALTKKLDDMEGQTSALKSKIEACEDEEKNIYDSYFLGKCMEKDLKGLREKTRTAKDALSTHSKMIESLNRCITGKEKEINTLHKGVDNIRHEVWVSLFEQRAAEIPESVRAIVNELVTIGLNCSMGRDFILPKIFPLPNNTEIQQIYQRIATALNIE